MPQRHSAIKKNAAQLVRQKQQKLFKIAAAKRPIIGVTSFTFPTITTVFFRKRNINQ